MPARAAPVCAMVGKPFLMSAAMFTIEPPWLLHRLLEDLAADDEAAGEVVAHHDVEALGADVGGQATGTGRRRC